MEHITNALKAVLASLIIVTLILLALVFSTPRSVNAPTPGGRGSALDGEMQPNPPVKAVATPVVQEQ